MPRSMRDFIPPIIYRKLVERPVGQELLKQYGSYSDALVDCSSQAYEENDLVNVVVLKTKRFVADLETGPINLWHTSAYSLLALLNPISGSDTVVKVLDFGGAAGAHYFIARKFLDKKVKLQWVVVETPAMVKAASIFSNQELSFCDDLEKAVADLGQIHLVHSSGTLQCVDDPDKVLSSLVNVGSDWIIFNRLGLNEMDTDVITIHRSMLTANGIGSLPEGYPDKEVSYPFTFSSERKFLERISSNYTIFSKFTDESGIYPVPGQKIVGYGLICKKS